MAETTQIKEAKALQLGVPGRPWPVIKKEYKKGSGLVTEMGVLEDDSKPLVINSQWYGHFLGQGMEPDNAEEAAYMRVLGAAYRDMPSPSMLNYFADSSLARLPERRGKLELVFGPPGIGKSYGAKLHSRLRDPRSPLVFDCAGRDLGDLLFELVLDRGANPDLYSRIQKRIHEHNSGDNPLKGPSVTLLQRPELRKVFSIEGKRIAWDWDSFGELPKDVVMEERVRQIDGSTVTQVRPYDREQVMNEARQALYEFARVEGIQMNGISDISFKEQKGKLLQAIEEDRNLIMDEVNLAKPGGFDKIKVPLQVLSGEIEEHTVYSKSGDPYALGRKSFGPNFFAHANGNFVGDGNSTQGLPESVYDRFRKYFLSKPTVEDFQHRICQTLTGVPVSTLYHLAEKQWKSHPEEFTQFLHVVRRLGLTSEEQANIPQHQTAMIDAWENVMEASSKLARFYHTWAEYMDRESEKFRTGQLQELAMEVDEHYSKMVGVSLRMMLRHMEQAEAVTPEAISREHSAGFDMASFRKPKSNNDIVKEEVELRFGSRLTNSIIEEIDNTTRQIAKPALNKHLMQLAANCGIVEAELKEAKKSDQKLLAELLNIDSFKGQSPSQQAKMVRELLCDFLRNKYPDLSASNDDLITIPQVERQLRELGQVKEKDIVISTHATRMRVPNSDLDDVSVNPFRSIIVHSSTYDPARKTALSVPLDKLADHDAVIMALAIPAMRKDNLTAMWNKSMINAGDRGPQYDPKDDDNNQVLRMAMRDNPRHGVSITTVPCRKGEDKAHEATVHVIRDDKLDKTIVIGENIDPRTARMMSRTGVTYIDKTKPGAAASLNRAITEMLQQWKDNVATGILEDLQAAFLMSNTLLPRHEGEQMSLAEMMTRDVTRCDVKNYATDAKQIEELLHLQKSFQSTTTSQRR